MDDLNDAPKSDLVSADPKPAAPPAGAAYVTAASLMPEPTSLTDVIPRRSLHGIESGLSKAIDLEVVPNSFAPATASGEPVPHVRGPGQNPVDPVAAGLDTHNIIKSTDQGASMTLTGREASGREPATYVEKTGGAPLVKDSDVAPTSDPKG